MDLNIKTAFLSAILIFTASVLSPGQTVRTVSGTVEYFPPDHVSMDQAKALAVEHAKVQLIADEFGTLVGSVVSTTISSSGEKNVSNTFEVGESEVRGEWLETIGTPDVEMNVRNGKELVYIVSIKGRIRELKNNFIEIDAMLLKNGATEDSRSDTFKTGDCMSIFFRSPQAGFLTVYLVGEDSKAQRLIPYGQNEGGSASVDANKRYVFFSPNESSHPDLTLFTDRDIENNRLYVIFSSNNFAHPMDDVSDGSYAGGYLPNSLAYDEFRAWLHKCRKRDSQMTVKIIDFTIEGLKH